MARTHHATRTWRLSCGCLRDYPGMPLGKVHSVLCTTCQEAVVTEYAYPERRCGYTTATRREGRLIRISCTNPEDSPECRRGGHFDRLMQLSFTSPGRLHSRGEGQVSRALTALTGLRVMVR